MENMGLYIHIPFCEKKCGYCDFVSFANKEVLIEPYLGHLAQEIRRKTRGKRFETIFIGGGTPSHLSAAQLQLLGEALQDVDRTPDCECTMECNPGNITREKAKVIQRMGVNRLSLGLQSSDNHILLEIGRIHTFEMFRENYEMLRGQGFRNINVDIIYGLPGESLGILEKTLNDVLRLEPEHISCYSLIIEEKTPFHVRHQKHQLDLPSEDVERAMNTLIQGKLSDHGYERYEISNYAKEGKSCKHNIIYWEGRNYVACGTAAHEYVDGVRRANLRTVEGYMRAMESRGDATDTLHRNSRDEEMEEFMIMGMRLLRGISKEDFRKRFGAEIHAVYGNAIAKHVEGGLLHESDGRLRFTAQGVEFSNRVLRDFLLSAT